MPVARPARLSDGSPVSFSAAAVHLGISERHLYRLRDSKQVRTIRFGRRVMIPADELQRLATKGC